ncbi:phenylacetate--CoA ligase family protein [Thauera phenolivorans]|uniref:phenylacetate--CoA ligase family protein n=1 Tax=Thauera phenolivorans TaxID=1792543 RepID=UPI00083A6EDC|nr:phenylacetate--CoA ligase family protein [Thauera phenolivorans]
MNLYTRLASELLFPLHERLKRHDTRAILRELERSQWYDPAQLEALQLSRLRDLLAAVAAQVPYYRERFRLEGLRPGDFETLDALALLPPTDKALIRHHLSNWQAEGTQGLARHSTSGSSGEPLHFLLGKHRISFDIAAKWRATRWWNVDVGDREMVLWGSPLEAAAQDRVRALRDRLLRSHLVPARDLNPGRIDAILDEMREFRPAMLFGYPSALARVAFRAREQGRRMDDLGIRAAFCTSEVLRPEWRQVIGEVFGCGVANEYGARDAGFIARECPHGGLHITAEELIVEVVDEAGQAQPAGVEGDILVTNLAGPEFPFIRYRTGDRGVLSARRCACGRGLPLIERLSGRANDGLVALDGSWVHGSAVNHALRELPGLEAYRIVQEARDRVRILLAAGAPLPTAALDTLAHHVRALLGAPLQVEILQVAEIPPEANGKFRHIVCMLDRTGAAAPSTPTEETA